jgi:hypothetical protein
MRTVRRILPLFAVLTLAAGQERVVESVVPALAYGARCSSTVELRNLSDRPVVVDMEPRRASGNENLRGSAPALGSEGRAFESPRPDQLNQ